MKTQSLVQVLHRPRAPSAPMTKNTVHLLHQERQTSARSALVMEFLGPLTVHLLHTLKDYQEGATRCWALWAALGLLQKPLGLRWPFFVKDCESALQSRGVVLPNGRPKWLSANKVTRAEAVLRACRVHTFAMRSHRRPW